MAAPVIGRRKRWAPKPGAAIDWSHPLAVGLNSVVILGQYPRVTDLVTGSIPDVFEPTAAGFESSIYGQGYQFQNNVSTSRFEWSLTSKPLVTHPLSVLVVGNTPFQNCILVSQGGASTGKGWAFGTSGPGGNLQYILGGVAAYSSSGGVPASFLMPMHVGVSVDGDGGTASFYSDGRGVGSATVGTMGAPPSKGLTLGCLHNGTSYASPFIRGITAVYVWSRALTAAEFAALYADPFQMLRF